MSNSPSNKEREYLNALGYSSLNKISKLNRRLIRKLIDNHIQPDEVEKKLKGRNYKAVSDEEKQTFIDKLIEFFNKPINNDEDSIEAEIIDDEEVKFIDANERIPKPKPNLKHIETINRNNNLSKMSKGDLNIKRKVNYDDRLNFMNYSPSEELGTRESEERVFGGKYKDVFNDAKHPYWNKTTRYNSRLEHPNYASYYAQKHGGKAYRGDFNSDGIDDIIITNKSGNVTHINGHSMSKSKRGVDLEYYDSDAYKNLDHYYTNKQGKKVLQLNNPTSKKEWINELSDVKKKDLNKDLRKAGFAGFKVKDEKVEKLLKENAKIVYDKVRNSIVEQFKLDKTEVSRHLSSATFASRVINAILLDAGGFFDEKAPKINDADLPFYLNKLRKLFNKTDNNRQKIFNYGNEMLLAIDDSASLPEFAATIYKISSAEPTVKSYEALSDIINNALEMSGELSEDKYYYDGIRTKNGNLKKRPSPKGKK